VSAAPIRDSNRKIVGIVLIFRDVTQQRALEAALKSNDRLAIAGRLSASIAHEIHNPLDIVGNVLFLLDQQVGTQPKARQLIETAQREVQRVAEISKNMLSLHRESRAPSEVKLSELLRGVVALVEETIAKGRRKIELIPGFEGEVEAFPSELRQVFTNVIKNAVEATADGGNVRIYSEATRQSGQSGVLVRVVDNGPGIPEQLQSKLFSPFVSTKEESGTGLGLWVSRSIMEKHGGSIRLSSNSELDTRGTTVSIFIPFKVKSPDKRGGDSVAATQFSERPALTDN
jgi:signal transduction histidine kinase